MMVGLYSAPRTLTCIVYLMIACDEDNEDKLRFPNF